MDRFFPSTGKLPLKLTFFLLLCLLCVPVSTTAEEHVINPQSIPAQEYTAKPGDFITVTVWERQTLSGTVTVDTNGNITLPVPIGSISVVGLTATQISDLLTERLEEYMVSPTVFVSISPAEGFTVHVLGEADLKKVRVIRGTGEIEQIDISTLKEAIPKDFSTIRSFTLYPGDTFEVQKKRKLINWSWPLALTVVSVISIVYNMIK